MILSDYGKGVLGPKVIEAAIAGARAPRRAGLCRSEKRRFRAATAAPPASRRTSASWRWRRSMPVASDAEIVAAATQGHARQRQPRPSSRPARKRAWRWSRRRARCISKRRARSEVFDVSGRRRHGDRGAGARRAPAAIRCAQAMRLANTAAGIVVSKLGTATVELDELMLELSRDVRDKDWHRAKYYSARRGRDAGAALEKPRAAGRLHQWLLRHPACRACRAAGGGARAMRPADRRAQYRSRRAPAQGAEAPGQRAWPTAPP